MKTFSKKQSNGQSMVILALAFVGMLGFTGVAIDGGMLYTERRHAQNAADAASMAGALAILQNGDPVAAAYARAAANDYNDNGASNWVTVSNPPTSGPHAGDWNHVQVIIRSRVDSVFAHFVFGGPLESTVEAVGRAKPATVLPLLGGHAIVGLAETGCAVVWSHGNNETDLYGGGIHVNSNHPDCAFKASGSNVLTVHGDYDINVVGGFEIAGTASVSPLPITGTGAVETPVIPPPTCTSSGTRDSSTNTLTPGHIDDFDFHTGSWTLESGIYCVDGSFTVNGGVSLTGSDILIYMMNGDVTWNGGATINLDAMDDGVYAGLLIYQDPSNTNMATINGDSNSHFTGTMLFPGAEVQINGTGAVDGFHSQVIGNTVDMSGTSDFNIIYEAGENYAVRDPAQVELAQ